MQHNTSNKEALKAYRKKQEEIAKLMDNLRSKLKRHAGEYIHWGHVGDLGHVKELLSEINESFG